MVNMEKNLDSEEIHPPVAEPERKASPITSMESMDSFLFFPFLNAMGGNPQKTETLALTWPEYLRLLQTAQTLGNKRAEMLVKLFCETGIRLREASNVTLEAVNAGEIVTISRNRPKPIPLSPELRGELRDYADSIGVRSGPLFVRQSGEPLDHSEILQMIVKLFKKAGVPREKATTKNLRLFHRDWATRDRIHAEVAEQVREIYESLLSRGRPFTT